MDRLVKPDVKELEISYKKGQVCTTTFRLTNLMHTMSVAVSLTTSNPSVFSFTQPFSIMPPLSSSSYLLTLPHTSDLHPPISTPPDIINVRSSMLPTGKAHLDDLRRLFSRPGPHVFRDATIPISLVGTQVAEYIIFHQTQIPDVGSYFRKAISGCVGSQLRVLVKSAVMSGNAGFVTSLIDEGIDVNFRDSDGQSLISLGVKGGSFDVVKALIASGCVIDESVDRVLHDAAAINRVDLMKVLCGNFENLHINSVDSYGRTPIHVAASFGHVEVIEFCMSVGGKVEVFDCNRCIPLHLAAENGRLEAVKCLLDCPNHVKYVVNKEGKTAFTVALDNGHSQLYDLLHLGDALQRSARLDDVNGIKSCLAEGAKVNGRDQNGWTPLHRAAFKGRIESVKVLLSHGAQVDTVDDAGYTPLHCAVEAGHVQVALLLIAHGARGNLKCLKAGLAPSNLDSCLKSQQQPCRVKLSCQEQEQEQEQEGENEVSVC